MVTASRILVVALALPSALAPAMAQTVPTEYRLKAAFVYQFPQFVEWPPAAWQHARTLELCVAHPNPFGPHLAELVRGESLYGRPLAVREITSPDRLSGCHLLFAGAGSPDALALLRASAGKPILTVGESDEFLDRGGMIVLRIVDRRVRFEVNRDSAEAAGLRISSRLLSLALAVHGGTL